MFEVALQIIKALNNDYLLSYSRFIDQRNFKLADSIHEVRLRLYANLKSIVIDILFNLTIVLSFVIKVLSTFTRIETV